MRPRTQEGFSLIELVVALALTGVLMSGMAKVFGSTLSNLHASSDLTRAQQRTRWMMDRLSDELKMAGHTDGMSIPLSGMAEPPFLVIPGGTEAEPRDILQVFSNQPLQEGTLTTALSPGDTTFTVQPTGADALHVKAGDWFLLKDGPGSEVGFVDSVAGNRVTMKDAAGIQSLPAGQVMDQGSGCMAFKHAANTSTLSFLRPLQLVRYAIQDMALDPANLKATVPCLVRQETTYQGTAVDWAKVPATLVAPNAQAFRVDLSPDAGRTWTRAGAKDWASVKAAANAKLDAGNRIDDGELWFKRAAMLLRVDLTSRTPTPRTEYAAKTGEASYGLRTQTLLVAPRNFANPL